MGGKGTVSIIISTLNEGEWLKRTIDTIIENTCYSPYNLIVFDDGSTDGSCDFLINKKYNKFSIKHITVYSLGVAKSRNKAQDISDAEFFIFLDAHVLPDPGWLDELVCILSEPSVGLAGTCIRSILNPEEKGYGLIIAKPDLTIWWGKKISNDIFETPCLSGGCLGVRRDYFTQVGGFFPTDTRWGFEDIELSIRTWLLGYRCVVSPRIEVAHLPKINSARPYKFTEEDNDSNRLRACFALFGKHRIAKVINSLKTRSHFAMSLARICNDSEYWEWRHQQQKRLIYDDDWFFSKFSNVMNDILDLEYDKSTND